MDVRQPGESKDDVSHHVVPLMLAGKDYPKDQTFNVTSPLDGSVVWRASDATSEDACAAAECAHSAYHNWSRVRPSRRQAIFLRAADVLERRRDELAGYMRMETGAEPAWSAGVDIRGGAALLRDVAGRISSIQGSIPTCAKEGMNALVLKEPYGVVLGLAPWNAPIVLGIRAVAAALAAGNTAVLKGSELSPRCYWAIGSVFAEAGLPDGVLNILFSSRERAVKVTTALVEHPYVKKVNFTGSTAVGRAIAKTAGMNLKPVVLELGGKASALVLPDADLTKAAHACIMGAFLNSGQICMSTERILVHASIAEAFGVKLRTAMEELYGSADTPVLVSSAAVAKSRQLVESAIDSGASVLAGSLDPVRSSGSRMHPIIVQNVSNHMELYHTESFGPTVSVITVESEEEAVRIANDTEYGLSAAVFTENLSTGLRVAKQIESGAVHINGMTFHDETSLPHGGMKSSGFGRFGASWGIEEFLRTKTITYRD